MGHGELGMGNEDTLCLGARSATEVSMRNVELEGRTKRFAVRVIKMCSRLPQNAVGDVLGKQVLRSGTSVAANYREACRARSTAEMISKLGIVEQELSETAL